MSSPVEQLVSIPLPLFQTYTGHVGYVTAGMGVRNTGRGTISLRTPVGTSLIAAWLYWTILDGTTPNPNNNKITVNGILVTGTLIGSGPSPCWTPPKGYAYRASVLTQLSNAEGRYGISYGLEIGGMSTAVTSGVSPWYPTSTAAPMAESVHLILVYTDPSIAGSVVRIYNGYFELSGGTATFAYVWPAVASGTARWSHLTADGQRALIPNPLTKWIDFTFGATTTTIDKPALGGDDPSLTSKATHRGSLSDTQTFNVGYLVPLAGGASTISWITPTDCISWVALVFGQGVDA